MKEKAIQALVDQVYAWTIFLGTTSRRQPDPCLFHPEIEDLKIIQKYGPYASAWDPGDDSGSEESCPIQVRHRSAFCIDGYIQFIPNSIDPLLSTYNCTGLNQTEAPAGSCQSIYCEGVWELRQILKMDQEALSNNFYTLLKEDAKELESWPMKVVDVTSGPTVYTALQEIEARKLIENRVRRMVAIREGHGQK